MKSSAELRSSFLDYFAQRGHQVVPSSPLIPADDPTLLFTNAGMVQFKDIFLGREQRAYTRAASAQRCVRAGGKHNDLENVGYTARHHTFFEMLGNFSFGDYFKREAIKYAWEYLTGVLAVPPERLWVTVFTDDDEAAAIWLDELKVDPARFSRCGEKDNFWSMGETGPCGPCSEIFYDHGPEVAGGPPGSPGEDGDRYVEIWNLVFMQYNRDAEAAAHAPAATVGGYRHGAGATGGGHAGRAQQLRDRSLPQPDRCRGGELRAARTGPASRCGSLPTTSAPPLSWSPTALLPGNEGRGYVLRRIIRRAIRHGYKLGVRRAVLLHAWSPPLDAEMGEAYPELPPRAEQRRAGPAAGGGALRRDLDPGHADTRAGHRRTVEGKVIRARPCSSSTTPTAFPSDLTADIARERGLAVDLAGFEREMERQRRAGACRKPVSAARRTAIAASCEGEPPSSSRLRAALSRRARGSALFAGRRSRARTSSAGEEGVVVLDRTPFYAESGGQVGDRGWLTRRRCACSRSLDTQKQGGAHRAHRHACSEGALSVRRRASRPPSTPSAARPTAAEPLRHPPAARGAAPGARRARTAEGLAGGAGPPALRFLPLRAGEPGADRRHRGLVNAEIRDNDDGRDPPHALSHEGHRSGAMALFGEKYGDRGPGARAWAIFPWSCAAARTRARTGDIGLFKIVAESGVAAGVRRIEAVTGERRLRLDCGHGEPPARRRRTPDKPIATTCLRRVEQLLEKGRRQDKDMQALKAKMAAGSSGDIAARAVDIDGVKVLAAELEGADADTLRDTADQLKSKLGTAAVVLAADEDGKVRLVAGVTKDLSKRLNAGELMKPLR